MQLRSVLVYVAVSNVLTAVIASTNATNSTLVDTDPLTRRDSGNDIWNLLKAVCVIMIIILLGYMARVTGYILPEAEKGIADIAGRVALPALLANSIARADIPGFVSEGGLKVVAVDLVCKLVVSLVAMGIAALQRHRDVPKISLMGAYAVFVTNANYMAVGVPLITAIFGTQYILYLIFFAMVQNILVNPLFFGLMLFGLAKTSSEKRDDSMSNHADADDKLGVLKKALVRVVTNPLVIAAAIGLVYNLATMNSDHEMDVILAGVIDKTAYAFALCALFSLGMGTVGHVQAMASRAVVVPLMLILLKSLILPMLEKGFSEYFLPMQLTELLWVSGCIGTAASTALMTCTFVPSLGGIFRGATVLNLIMSLPLLVLSQTFFKSDDEGRQELTQYGRIAGNILSMVGLVMILLHFYAVKRWHVYPMWLIIDLALVGLPFYVGHYACHIVREIIPLPSVAFHIVYFITNVARIARRVYMMALSFILLVQVRWHRWFPKTPYGYAKSLGATPDAVQAEGQDQQDQDLYQCPFHLTMRKLHWAARIISVMAGLFGTIPFMLFVPLHPISGFSCWCAYGVPQWTVETISFVVVTSLQGFALFAYLIIRSRRQWQNEYQRKMFPGVKFGMAALLVLQFVCLLMHLLLLYEILEIGQENFQVDPVWLQPLVVLILLTDGGGFVLMFMFSTQDAAWETYKRIFYRSWVKISGKTPSRILKLHAMQMSTDTKLVDAYMPGCRCTVVANTFSGCDAVDWMLEYGGCSTREQAVNKCLQMVGKKLLINTDDQPLVSFHDAEDYHYRVKLPNVAPKCMRRAHDNEDEESSDEDRGSDQEGAQEKGSDQQSAQEHRQSTDRVASGVAHHSGGEDQRVSIFV